MNRKFLASTVASLLIFASSAIAPSVAGAAEQPGSPYSDQEWRLPPAFSPSFKPGGDFLVGQLFAPTQDGHLFEIDLWIFGIGPDGTPDDPVLDSAAVYDVTGLDYADFDVTEPIAGGQADIGDSAADPDAPGKFRLPLRFPDLPELSEEGRYLLVLEHAIGEEGSKASYAIGVEQPPPSDQPVLVTDEGIKTEACQSEWCGYTNGRIWHEIFLVDPIVPEDPELVESKTCDGPSTVEIPEVDGVEYVVDEDGHTQTVTAVVAEGFFRIGKP